MIIPLGTDRPSKRPALVTPVLIGVNLGVFVMMAILAKFNPQVAQQIDFLGAISRTHFHFWQPITSAFLHAGFMHIFGNMIFLLAFGPSVEDRFGRLGFLLFYLFGASASGFVHIALSPVPAIGASGAIAAVAGAFLVLFPNTKIKCFVFFFIIGIFMIPAWWLIGLFVVLDLGAQLFRPDNGIANLAHLGGYGFGAGLSFVLLVVGILPKEPYDMFSIIKHKKRRAEFKSAYNQAAHSKVFRESKPIDPVVEELAQRRAKISSLLNQGEVDEAMKQYQAMLEAYAHEPKVSNKSLTLHRDAQYQIANQFYQAGLRQDSAQAYDRLLEAYPNDPERDLITILLARIRAHDLGDPIGAIGLLEELLSKAHDADTQALIESELASIRDLPSNLPDQKEPSP